VLQLHADRFLHRAVLEDAAAWFVLPNHVVEPLQDARQRFGEKRPHLAQRRPHRLIDLKHIEADSVPVGGHRRLRREGEG